MKKFFVVFLAAAFITLQSCGTILRTDRIGKPHSDRVDLVVFLLDAAGLVLFFVPGIIAFSVDYLNGTLFLPNNTTAHLTDTSPEAIQKVLAEHNIKVSIADLKKGQALRAK